MATGGRYLSKNSYFVAKTSRLRSRKLRFIQVPHSGDRTTPAN